MAALAIGVRVAHTFYVDVPVAEISEYSTTGLQAMAWFEGTITSMTDTSARVIFDDGDFLDFSVWTSALSPRLNVCDAVFIMAAVVFRRTFVV